MARRSGRKGLLARLVTGDNAPCAFCQRKVDDEITYGKLYAIGDIQCHYFCVLLSCCLVQQGSDDEGLFGFMYTDILAELERSKKHRCSYCGCEGATLGCSVTQCRKQFHLPCGRERNAVSLFYGNYKSFCQLHAPKQKIPDSIMVKAKLRMRDDRKRTKNFKRPENINNLREFSDESHVCSEAQDSEVESVCVICYERVEGYPTLQTFWPPCCARDAWFHRSCLQRMALSAGMHYLKCPLCNDKEQFYQAVVSQGYYVPDRDAAWELEQNAFAEIYERPLSCSAPECKCPMGRNHDSDAGPWDIKLCILCGSSGAHAQCGAEEARAHVCGACRPAAPIDLDSLASSIEAVILQEQAVSAATVRHGPVMPSRMSLRRTKQRVAAQNTASSSSSNNTQVKTENDLQVPSPNTTLSRQELNLKTPKKPVQTTLEPTALKDIENPSSVLLSPIKLLENTFYEKVTCMGVKDAVLDSRIVEEMRIRFRKPKPLSEKRRIVNNILDDLFNSILKENPKQKEPVKEWLSPKKICDIKVEGPKFDIRYKTIKETPSENISETCNKQDEIQSENINVRTPKKIATPKKDIEEVTMDNNQDINEMIKEEILSQNEDSSNSTFQLPSEFIADHNSNDSLLLFETPKKLKTVDIQKDSSLEISENDQMVNIDVIKLEDNNQSNNFIKHLNLKVPIKNKKCAFKFSPIDKETLGKSNIDIDVESFKNHYLNEVDREFKCSFNTDISGDQFKLRTATDFAVDAVLKQGVEEKHEIKSLKRKLHTAQSISKRRKMVDSKLVLKFKNDNKKDPKEVNFKPKNKIIKKRNRKRHTNGKLNISFVDKANDNIKVTVDSAKNYIGKRRKMKKQQKNVLSLCNKDLKVKIKWRREKLRLKITESKTKKFKKVNRNEASLKQYVLQCSPEANEKVLVKPKIDVTPIKRKYIKKEKSSDKLVQTSIQNFFKIQIPKD